MSRLIFLGSPGAGKGTQAKALSSALRIPHISTGEILRAERKNKTKLGVQAQSYIDRGEFVPDQLILNLVRGLLTQSNSAQRWILDGFPRNVSQALFLDSLLVEVDQPYDAVIYLNVPDVVIVPRLRQRAIEEQRPDDADEYVIQKRLDEYRKLTTPLIELYQKRGQLIEINGNMPKEQVTTRLIEALNAQLKIS